MKRKSIVYTIVSLLMLGGFTACEDMLDVSSSSVQYEGTHEINSAGDSLYSVIGIMSKLQSIGDRTVLMGELRGDLVVDNEYTENDLRELINHNVSPSNTYCDYSDYYAIINNCNYFLAKVDTTVVVSKENVLVKEYAAVKAIRAWTYMQLALIYQSVPFVTEPILSVVDAEKEYPHYDLAMMCDYFIPELLPFVDTKLPSYGNIDGVESKSFFFPIRLLLADMYLWKQDYLNAFRYYAEYAYENSLTTVQNGATVSSLSPSTNDISGIGISSSSGENISVIRMASSKLYGTVSQLPNMFSPTDVNEGRRMISPSYLWKELSEQQDYAYTSGESGVVRYLSCGDLRAFATYSSEWSDGSFNPDLGESEEAWYLVDVDNKYKINSKYDGTFRDIPIYRIGTVYLRMAEALNRVGEPMNAFKILKSGLASIRVTSTGYSFTYPEKDGGSVIGIHSRGCGSSIANERYVLDLSELEYTDTLHRVAFHHDDSVTYKYGVIRDTVAYLSAAYGNDLILVDSTLKKPYLTGDPDTLFYVYGPREYLVGKLEDMIVDEMALEAAFEGHRFYDLMRVALRRGDPSYLAAKVAAREGKNAPRDEALYQRLLNTDNWYIRKE